MTGPGGFLYVCDKRFEDLEGTRTTYRTCGDCFKVVHNLDAMAPEARADLFARAERERTTVCVSVLVPLGKRPNCRDDLPRPPSDLPQQFFPVAGMVRHDPVAYSPPRREEANAIVFDCNASVEEISRAVERVGPSMGLVEGPTGWGYISEPRVHLFHVSADATRGWGIDLCVSDGDACAQLGFRVHIADPGYNANEMGCAPKVLMLAIFGAVIAWFVKWGFNPLPLIGAIALIASIYAGGWLSARLGRARHRRTVEAKTAHSQAYARALHDAVVRELAATMAAGPFRR